MSYGFLLIRQGPHVNVATFIRKSLYPSRYYLIGPFIWIIYYALYGSLQPYLIKQLIDTAVPEGGADQVQGLLHISGYFLALLISYELFYLLYDWCDIRIKASLKNNIALTLVNRVLEQDLRFFQKRFTGNMIAKLNDVIYFTPDIVRTIIDNYITNAASVLVGMFLLWQVHVGFALALCIWAIAFAVLSLTTLHRFRHLSTNLAEASSKVIGMIVDMFTNALTIKLFAAKNHELSYLARSLGSYRAAFNKRRWFIFKLYSAQAVSYQLYQASCLFFLIYLYSLHKVTAGDFAMILMLNLWIIDCMWDMSDRMRTLSESWGAIDQALKIIYRPPHIHDAPHATELKVTQGNIVFENVSFQHKDGPLLFKDLSLSIKAGEKVGLVGYSGSGKTTFVNLLLRIYDVTSGRILIDGQDIKTVTQDSLHKAIGVNPQDPILFHRTIKENIRYGKPDATDQEIINVAKKVHAESFIEQAPEKYDMLVGERGLKLSGGQRQRITMARMILKDAPILVLDEATSQLDSETEKFIQQSLEDIMAHKTSLVIAHRLSTLQHLTRILVFDNGAIVQDGTHDELIKTPGLYRTLWENQQRGFLPETLNQQSA